MVLMGDSPWEEAVALPRGPGQELRAAKVPQPRTIEAMCKANWPAHKRPTEAD